MGTFIFEITCMFFGVKIKNQKSVFGGWHRKTDFGICLINSSDVPKYQYLPFWVLVSPMCRNISICLSGYWYRPQRADTFVKNIYIYIFKNKQNNEDNANFYYFSFCCREAKICLFDEK